MKWTVISFCLWAILPSFAQIEPDQLFPRLIAHVPKLDQGFKAVLLLNNDSKFKKEVYFTPYNELGEPLLQGDPEVYRVAPKTTKVLKGEEILPEGTTHLTVHNSSMVRVSIMYGTQIDFGGSQALLHESEQAGRRFIIYPTSGSPGQGYWEGLAMVNLGGSRTKIIFTLQDLNGNAIASEELALDPMAKLTTLLSDVFDTSFQDDQYQIEVVSEDSIAMVMLSGNSQQHDLSNVTPESLPFLDPLVESEDVADLPKNILSIESIQFEEEIFSVSAVLPNPCHDLELYWNGAIQESFPPQVNLYLVARNVSDICFQPIVKKSRSFDLSSLAEAFKDFGGAPGEVLKVNLLDINHENIFTTYQFIPFQ